jgi:hypothetical protein
VTAALEPRRKKKSDGNERTWNVEASVRLLVESIEPTWQGECASASSFAVWAQAGRKCMQCGHHGA